METESESGRSVVAWQPFTLVGLAAFARADQSRLVWVGLLVALIGVGSLMCAFQRRIEPRIEEVAPRIPAGAALRGGRLVWPTQELQLLSSGPTLSVVADPGATFALGAVAEFHLHLLPDHFRIYSLFGHVRLPYPSGSFSLEPRQLIPAWSAWRGVVLAALGGFFFLQLWVCWVVLSLAALPWLVVAGLFAGRGPGVWGGFKLGIAAAWPGSLLMSGGVALFGRGDCGLSGLAFFGVAHLLVNAVYVLLAPLAFRDSGKRVGAAAGPVGRTRRKTPFDAKD